MRTPLTLAALAALALTRPAAAEDGDSPRPRPSRLDLSVGLAFLTHGAGDYLGDLDSFYIDVGMRRGRFFAFAQYQDGRNAGDLSNPELRGSIQRASLNLRYDRGNPYLTVGRTTVDVGPFFEIGAGYEWMHWGVDGRAARPDLSIGVGGAVRMGRRHHELGYEIGVRFITAPGSERMDGAVDHGGMFFLGIPFSP